MRHGDQGYGSHNKPTFPWHGSRDVVTRAGYSDPSAMDLACLKHKHFSCRHIASYVPVVADETTIKDPDILVRIWLNEVVFLIEFSSRKREIIS